MKKNDIMGDVSEADKIRIGKAIFEKLTKVNGIGYIVDKELGTFKDSIFAFGQGVLWFFPTSLFHKIGFPILQIVTALAVMIINIIKIPLLLLDFVFGIFVMLWLCVTGQIVSIPRYMPKIKKDLNIK